MKNSLYFCNVDLNEKSSKIISLFENYSNKKQIPLYIINKPMGENRFQYDYEDVLVVLIPKHKIIIINCDESSESNEDFKLFVEDFSEDLGYLSEKYDYKEVLGRPRRWKIRYICQKSSNNFIEASSIDDALSGEILQNNQDERNVEFLISLLIGSINDIEKTGSNYPDTLLDKVKQKIILFDGEQSRFIYDESSEKRINIQGLAGTGKTELLLHKLKEIYTKNKKSKIAFTCFNKILAKNMRERIPKFFDFMKVEEQIKWNERMWVIRSWGSKSDKDSGIYSYICSKYNLTFHPYSYSMSFDKVCKVAIDELEQYKKENIDQFEYCFDYMLIDESQDFPNSFFKLCEIVTEYQIYVAGDIFQDIYDRNINQAVKADYLLNKCYRTDPKTLMFAHALEMGLYEEPVIRWLDPVEWEACGYNLRRVSGKVKVTREPLRRFEDLDSSSINSIQLINVEKSYSDKILEILEDIKCKNDTVQPEDIAIVFLENLPLNYSMADCLEYEIKKKFNWSIVKGYETKDIGEKSLFISNRNNIKGLEFPFVICVVREEIKDDLAARNSIYMMLTRSFITSYFLIDDKNKEIGEIFTKAIKDITNTGAMNLREPSDEEKSTQNQLLIEKSKERKKSQREVVDEILKDYNKLDREKKNKIRKVVPQLVGNTNEKDIKNAIERILPIVNGECDEG